MVQDDKKIEKILFRTEKMTKTDDKITLCKIQFNLDACKDLSKVMLNSLSDTASNFFILCTLLETSSNYVIL